MKTSIQSAGIKILATILLSGLIVACGNTNDEQHSSKEHGHGETHEVEVSKGPHGGRLLESGNFTLELAIFETGVPPEFRAWASQKGQPLKPDEVDLNITLTRLGGKVDDINFKPQGDAMRGGTVIYEPHSFVVTINALHNGIQHTWQYDNFEGRTKIEKAVADALEIETSISGPVVLQETIGVFGKITANPEGVSNINARFSGVIKSVSVSIGDTVRRGQTLATVESNESLKLYSIKSPISGVLTQRNANPGEQTSDRQLFTVTDTSTVWVELSLFPADRQRVQTGAIVSLELADGKPPIQGKITSINVTAESNQSVTARMVVDNKNGQLIPGSYVKAQIKVAEHPVALAVHRSGLQAFRDFTVVYAKIGEEYEVRMLDLGRQDNEWIEVLGGLEPGTEYVSKNSYVIKADIEKSGAAHDH